MPTIATVRGCLMTPAGAVRSETADPSADIFFATSMLTI